jgi:hypothetical protein
VARHPFRSLLLGLVALTLIIGGASAVIAAPPGGVPTSQGVGGPVFNEQDVFDTLHQWALGYDEHSLPMEERLHLMRDAFTEDAVFIYGSPAFAEPIVFEGIESLMGLFVGALESQDDVRRHVMSNSMVERLDRRTVRVTSYLTLLVIADPAGVPVLQSTGVYRDTLVLESDGKWRIKERDLRLDTAA